MSATSATQMECRIVITHLPEGEFKLGMYDPRSGRHEPLGKHSAEKIERIVGDLRTRMEREGHLVTYTEWTGER